MGILKSLKPCGNSRENYGRGPKKLLVKLVPHQDDPDYDDGEAGPKEFMFDVEAPCVAEAVKELLLPLLVDLTVDSTEPLQQNDIRLMFRGRMIHDGEFLDKEVYRIATLDHDTSDVEEIEPSYALWASIFTEEDAEVLEAEAKGDKNARGPKSRQMKRRLKRQASKKTQENKATTIASEEDLEQDKSRVPAIEDSLLMGGDLGANRGSLSLESFVHAESLESNLVNKFDKADQGGGPRPLTALQRYDSAVLLEHAARAEAFDVAAELRRIGCERWAADFAAEGYAQKGAFAHITDDRLRGNPFFMHKEARRKVLLLADMMKRQSATADTATSLERINSSVTTEEKYTYDGVHFYENLADLDRQWTRAHSTQVPWFERACDQCQVCPYCQEVVVQEEEAGGKAVPEEDGGGPPSAAAGAAAAPPPPPRGKPFSPHVRAVMARVHRRATLDAYGVPLEPHPGAAALARGWCCPKHERSVRARVAQIVRTQVDSAMVDVDFGLKAGDEFKTGFIPPSALIQVATAAFEACHIPASPAQISAVVDPCYAEGHGLWVDQRLFRAGLRARLTEGCSARMLDPASKGRRGGEEG